MQRGVVIGHATSTVKHPSFTGWRLVVVQPMGAANVADGDPVLAVDHFGSGVGQPVIINCDGLGAREYVGDPKSPARWFVIGQAEA